MTADDLTAVRTLFAGHSDMRELPLNARRAAVMLKLELTPIAGAVSALLLRDAAECGSHGLIVYDPELSPAQQRADIALAVAEYIAGTCGYDWPEDAPQLAALFGVTCDR